MANALIAPWSSYDANTNGADAIANVNRGMAYLSTGEIITVESTGGAAIAIHRFDPTTLATTLITSLATGPLSAASSSITVDSADNIHVVYRNAVSALEYRRLLKGAGLTWTVGSAESVQGTAANVTVGRTDIEVLDSGVVVVAWNDVDATNAAQKIPRHRMRARHTGGAWGAVSNVSLSTSAGVDPTTVCSIARDLAGASGGTQRIAFAYGPKGNGVVGQFGTATVNLATGAIARTNVFNFGFSGGNTRLYGQLFSVANDTWAYVGMTNHAAGTNLCTTEYFRYSTIGGVLEQAAPLAQWDATYPTLVSSVPTFALVGNAAVLLNTFSIGGFSTLQARVYHPGVGWSSTFAWQQGHTDNSFGTGIGVEYLRAGANRNRPADRLHVAAMNTRQWMGGSQPRQHFLYYNPAPAAPTTLAPGNASFNTTQSDDRPMLTSLTAALPRGNERRRLRWQIDTTAAFSGAQRTVEQPVSALQMAGSAHYMAVDAPNELFQGTWYIRAAAIDEFGRVGPYKGPQSFIISHPPQPTNQTPSAGKLVAFGAGSVTLAWTFQDASPHDFQTAYQVVLMNNNDGSIIADSGKVVSTDKQHTFNGLSAALKDIELRWAVIVWDSDDVPSPALEAARQSVFSLGDAPVVTITAPVAASTVNNPNVGFGWTAVFGGGRTQREYKVSIVQGSTTVYDSGWIVGTDNTFTIPPDVLTSGVNYVATVALRDTGGIEGSATVGFATLWVPPAAPVFTVDTDDFDTSGYVRVAWTHANADPDFIAYRVYARQIGDADWIMLYETAASQADYTRDEFLIWSAEQFEIKVVQVANRFGAQVESQTAPQTHTANGSYYWLIINQGSTQLAFRLNNVTSDSYDDEWDQEFLPVLGLGRMEDRGDHWGVTGSMTAQLRDREGGQTARLQRQTLVQMKELVLPMYLRTPFGDLLKVGVGGLNVSRVAGVGAREFVDLTIPYTELA